MILFIDFYPSGTIDQEMHVRKISVSSFPKLVTYSKPMDHSYDHMSNMHIYTVS